VEVVIKRQIINHQFNHSHRVTLEIAGFRHCCGSTGVKGAGGPSPLNCLSGLYSVKLTVKLLQKSGWQGKLWLDIQLS